MHGLQNIVRTMVGDAVTEQSRTRRYRLRRAAKSRTETESDDEA